MKDTDKDLNRLERLTSILTKLQSNRLITSTTLADNFNVSVRTIYRDIRSLEQAGVPIITEEGKGYRLMDTYRLPPVMFTEQEANALVTAEALLSHHPDISLLEHLKGALSKVKAVLKSESKDKTEFLYSRMAVFGDAAGTTPTSFLAMIQTALTNFRVLYLEYTDENLQNTTRSVEPFAVMNSMKSGWYMVAYCQLRQDFRMFRLDRIRHMSMTPNKFNPHNLTLKDFFKKWHSGN